MEIDRINLGMAEDTFPLHHVEHVAALRLLQEEVPPTGKLIRSHLRRQASQRKHLLTSRKPSLRIDLSVECCPAFESCTRGTHEDQFRLDRSQTSPKRRHTLIGAEVEAALSFDVRARAKTTNTHHQSTRCSVAAEDPHDSHTIR